MRRTIAKIGLVSSMLICFVLMLGLSSALAAEKIIMKIGHADAQDVFTSRKHSQLIAFKEIVNAKSDGRIEVRVFGGGSMGGERELIESVKLGTMQMTSCSAAFGGFFPGDMIFSIPYLFPSATVAWQVLDGPFGKQMSDAAFKATGMRNLGFAEVGFRNLTNNKRPIRTPADMVGLKMRIQENPLWHIIMKSWGANATPVAWPETYTALSSGTVDGQENPVSVILNSKLQEVQKYMTLSEHVYGVDWLLINEKFWQSLPKDLQAIVQEAAKISCTVGRGVQQLNSGIGIAKILQAGVKIYTPTPQEKELFKKAAQGPAVAFVKTKADPKLVDAALKAVAAASKK